MNRILSGVQPTGALHLGNYLGAIRNWVRLQGEYECFFSVVDLHAITVPQDPAALRASVMDTAAAYIACGVDPAKSAIFRQSDLREVAELHWVLSTVARTGWLDRMTQFKDKAGDLEEQAVAWAEQNVHGGDAGYVAARVIEQFIASRDSVGAGLYTYPILMAADILSVKATHVPVGDDQRQHLQLTRQIATAFNHHHGEVFPLPQDLILGQAPRVMSLRYPDRKMSKSAESDQERINLTDTADEIAQKVKRATTDAEMLPGEPAALAGRAGAENLLRIWAALRDRSLEDACREFAGKGFGHLKRDLTDVLVEQVVPIGQRIVAFRETPDDLHAILHAGWDAARRIADTTVAEVHAALGLR